MQLLFVYAKDLHKYPEVADEMFKARRHNFIEKLKWKEPVSHDVGEGVERGWECDQYDPFQPTPENPFYIPPEKAHRNPLYIGCVTDTVDGGKITIGSGRFDLTLHSSMIADHFSELTNGEEIRDPHISEITRTCMMDVSKRQTLLHPQEYELALSVLYLGGTCFAHEANINQSVAVFDRFINRIYRKANFSPTHIFTEATRDSYGAGSWSMNDVAIAKLREKIGDPDMCYRIEYSARKAAREKFPYPLPVSEEEVSALEEQDDSPDPGKS